MKINSVHSPNFGKLITGESITKMLKAERPSNAFIYEWDKIEEALRMLEVDSKNNINVTMHHAPRVGFYGIISGSKTSIPETEALKCKISPNYRDILAFAKWVNEWDYALSEEAKEFKYRIKKG